MDCSRTAFPGPHHLPESDQTHVHWVSDAIHHLILHRPCLLLPSTFCFMWLKELCRCDWNGTILIYAGRPNISFSESLWLGDWKVQVRKGNVRTEAESEENEKYKQRWKIGRDIWRWYAADFKKRARDYEPGEGSLLIGKGLLMPSYYFPAVL